MFIKGTEKMNLDYFVQDNAPSLFLKIKKKCFGGPMHVA